MVQTVVHRLTPEPLLRYMRQGNNEVTPLPRAHDISICLVGFETHKARPDLSDDSSFWLRVKAEDVSHSFAKRLTAPAPCNRGTEASKVTLPGAPSKSETRMLHIRRTGLELSV
jgi:hypothetical protein